MTTFLNRTPIRCLALVLFLGFSLVPAIPLRVLVLACAALIWTFLEAGNLKPIGLGRHRPTAILIWGIGIAVGVTVVAEVLEPLIDHVFGLKPDYGGYGALAGNRTAALRMLALALTSAAIGEEILFRGFLLHQLTGILGSGKAVRWGAIVAGGVLFGAAHAMQGPLGVINTGVVGVIFGWAWFRTGRNLWAMILAHALIDSYSIAMMYLGWLA